MKNIIRSTVFMLLFAAIALGFKAAADGDWTELDPVEGGWGGLYTSWTNIDSLAANPTYSDWTTKLSYCDGQVSNNAESFMTAVVYFNAGANDSLQLILQGRTNADNLITYCDTLGFKAGATTPVAVAYKVSLSSYARQYRVKLVPYTSGDGTANAVGGDVEVSFYCSKPDVINPHKSYLGRWEGGGLPSNRESKQLQYE